MNKYIIAFVLSFVVCGCNAESVLSKMKTVTTVSSGALNSGESLAEYLENNYPGYEGLPVDTKEKLLNALVTAEKAAPKLSGIASIIGAMVPKAAPIANDVASGIGYVGVLITSLAAFVRNRKAKQNEAVAAAAMKAGDSAIGFGKKVGDEAKKRNVGDAAEAIYKKHINPS